ncbi:MAG: CopD family protein [Terriglobia bacterium]
MTTFMQWVHVMAAIVGLGGMGFLLLILIPSLGVLSVEQREGLSKAVAGRFRWASWSAVALLLISGLYNVRRYYWEEPWDRAWKFLALKVILSFVLFGVVLGLTIPFRLFEPLRARRRTWLLVAFILGVVVVLISAYLRRS